MLSATKIVRGACWRVSRKERRHGQTGWFQFAQGPAKVDRIAIVNHLITLYGMTRYLEIGLRDRADMHDRILAPYRRSVDPDPAALADFVMTSDTFFAQDREAFDIVFIDGDHAGNQVERDIANALNVLAPGGMVLLHDINPPTAFHAREVYEVDGEFPEWHGTSWLGYAAHRRRNPDLEMLVVNTDWGVGVVRPGRQVLYDGPAESYGDLAANRRSLLNLISVEDFLTLHPVHDAAKAPRPLSPILSIGEVDP